MATPLWRDIIADLGTAARASFTVAMGTTSNVVYSGIAHRLPDATNIKVRLNDIFADNLQPRKDLNVAATFDTLEEEGVTGATFYVTSGGKTLTYEVTADYSHQNDVAVYSDPILPIIDTRMPFVASNLTATGGVAWAANAGGGTSETKGTLYRRASISNILYKATYLNLKWLNGVTQHFERKQTCADYAIYYINAFGGWDWLVLGGRCSVADGYSRSNVMRSYDNNDATARGVSNYLNEIKRTYTLRTSLLDDEQSAKMHHLLGTTRAILYNLNTSEATPVTITNASCDYKTFKGNNRRMSQYTITAEAATNIIRR